MIYAIGILSFVAGVAAAGTVAIFEITTLARRCRSLERKLAPFERDRDATGRWRSNKPEII